MSEQGKVAIFPLLLYCKQPLLGGVYRPALAVSGYEFQTKPSFYISPFHKRFDIIMTSDRLTFLFFLLLLGSKCTVIHCIVLMRFLDFFYLPIGDTEN